MAWERRVQLMCRWSLVTGVIIALFWGVWYLINGSVPTVTSVRITPDWTIQLPFAISRWWDVLIGPLWSVMLILILTNKRIWDNEDLKAGLVFGLVYGLAFGLAFGLALGLFVGLAFGLFVGLALGPIAGLAFGLVSGLVSGLVAGLVAGLVFGLAYGLVYGLGFGLGSFVRWIFSSRPHHKIFNWLMGR